MCDIRDYKPKVLEVLREFKKTVMVKPVTVSMADLAELAMLELGSKLGINCSDACFGPVASDWAKECLRDAYDEALQKGKESSEVHAYIRTNFPGFGKEAVEQVNQWLYEDGLNASPVRLPKVKSPLSAAAV
ncbi:MAG TPA: hypothetical protein VHP58_00475 [Alphaproteobacteria bacterium]|nr:hypothetical protein [Alphaproteobacteria bacterium]